MYVKGGAREQNIILLTVVLGQLSTTIIPNKSTIFKCKICIYALTCIYTFCDYIACHVTTKHWRKRNMPNFILDEEKYTPCCGQHHFLQVNYQKKFLLR